MKTMVLPVHSVSRAVETNGCGPRPAPADRPAPRDCAARGRNRPAPRRPPARRPRPPTVRPARRRPSPRACSASIVPNAFIKSLAVTMPTWRMPSPNRKRAGSKPTPRLDRGEQIVDRLLLPALAPDQLAAMRLAGGRCRPGRCSQPSSTNSTMLFSPSPSMSIAPRDTKCLQPLDPLRRADQPAGAADVDLALLGDRFATGIPGNGRGRRKAARFSSRVRFSTTCGMTSPARWMRTRSPTRRPSRAISSRLWSVTLATITPPTPTGFSRPTGVSLPVRPTWMSIASSVGLGLLGREFVRQPPARRARRPGRAAPASRAGRPCRPRRRCRTAGRRAPARSRIMGERLVDRLAAHRAGR